MILALALFSNSKKKPHVSGCALAVARASESERFVVKIMSEEVDAELQRQIELWQQDETDEAGQIETDAEFWQQVEIWQREAVADAAQSRIFDEWLERIRNETSDL